MENEGTEENEGALEISATETLSTMSAEEIIQHVQTCMKLAAENKINSKNAFGLHLIHAMQRLMKLETPDLQQASLSLQASAKIYAGRVEALYQDTFKFHNYLQSIVSGSKKVRIDTGSGEGTENEDERERARLDMYQFRACITTEENVSEELETILLEPHGNFATVNAAFSSSRTTHKLIQHLQIMDDTCKLNCGTPEKYFKARMPVISSSFTTFTKLPEIIDLVTTGGLTEEKHTEISDESYLSDVYTHSLLASTPAPPARPSVHEDLPIVHDNDGSPCSPSVGDRSADVPGLNSVIESFSVLDITAATFVRDVSQAVTRKGLIDKDLLPPNSVLKKIISADKKIIQRTGDVNEEDEKLFVGKHLSLKDFSSLMGKGSDITLDEEGLLEWTVDRASESIGYLIFEDELAEDYIDKQPDFISTFDAIEGTNFQYVFKYFFQNRPFILTRARRYAVAMTKYLENIRQTPEREDEVLVKSFQNLSLNESGARIDVPVDDDDDDILTSFVIPTEERKSVGSAKILGLNISDMMVQPPLLVKPEIIKYESNPAKIHTPQLKVLLWDIISKYLNGSEENLHREHLLFSDLYNELKEEMKKKGSDAISHQFAFVLVLMLANEKNLCIENIKDSPDISIKLNPGDVAENESNVICE